MSQCAWAFAASVLLPAAAPQLLFFLLVSFIPLFRAPDLSAFGYTPIWASCRHQVESFPERDRKVNVVYRCVISV